MTRLRKAVSLPTILVASFVFIVPFATSFLTIKLLIRISRVATTTPTPGTGAVFQLETAQFRLPPSFYSVNALLKLPSPLSTSLLVSDVETNEIYHIDTNMPAFASPLLRNAGGANSTTSASVLRRPGVADMKVYQSTPTQLQVLMARNAARDIVLITIEPAVASSNGYVPTVGSPICIVKQFNGSRLNAPHSIFVDDDGNLFFSDPTFGLILRPDEFDRALDNPNTMEQEGQHLYYIPASDLRTAVATGSPAEARMLVKNLDRPVGLAVAGEELFVAIASPRRPLLVRFRLSKTGEGEVTVVGDKTILHDWSKKLHGWGQDWISGVLGHICIVQDRLLVVGAGDSLVAFDITAGGGKYGNVTHKTWLEVKDSLHFGIPPGPPSAIREGEEHFYVAASDRVFKIGVNF